MDNVSAVVDMTPEVGTLDDPHYVGILVGYLLMIVIQGVLFKFWLWDWFVDMSKDPPTPEVFLKLMICSLVGMIITGGVCTMGFAEVPGVTEGVSGVTPLVKWYGYNNICIIFDYPPATFVMPAYWVIISMCCLCFTVTDSRRLASEKAVPQGVKFLGYATNALLTFNAATFSVCLSIGPAKNMYAHTLPFLCLIVIWPFVFISQYLETAPSHRGSKVLGGIVVLTILCVLKGSLTALALTTKDHVPTAFGQNVDRLWTVFFVASPFLLHEATAPKAWTAASTTESLLA